jgi:hypothetical protein
MKIPPRRDPYCSFRDDRERRNALIARDVRLVLLALITATSSPALLTRLASWFA